MGLVSKASQDLGQGRNTGQDLELPTVRVSAGRPRAKSSWMDTCLPSILREFQAPVSSNLEGSTNNDHGAGGSHTAKSFLRSYRRNREGPI